MPNATALPRARAPIPRVVAEHAANATELLYAVRFAAASGRGRDVFDELCARCEAHLDALRIAGPDALDRLRAAVGEEDDEAAAVLALLLAESEPDGLAVHDELLTLLTHTRWPVREAAWGGLRLTAPDHLASHLRPLVDRPMWDFAAAAAADALAFHRIAFVAGRKPLQPGEEESVTWLLAEACGRVQSGWSALRLPELLAHPSPRVRAAALRASARAGYRPLLAACRAAADTCGDPEHIEFLGVVGTAEDVPRLQRAAATPDTATAALRALGRLGVPAAMPSLLYFLDVPAVAEDAAAAITRLTGLVLPRGAPVSPPADMGEDERDLWEAVAPVEVAGARSWWAEVAERFDPARRWQAGVCVSDDPLGPAFDQIPLAAREDVYLRERARDRRVPDWELDTWSWRQRDPGGA